MNLTRGRVALILTLLVVSAYSNALQNELVWDDSFLVTDNLQIRNVGYFIPAFTTDLFHNYSVEVATHYRPMQTLSLMSDYALWGSNPFGYHLTNVVLHLACTLLLAALLATVAGDLWVALLGAAIFAVHPVNTNAVTYVSGRADPLAFGFMLVAFLSFIHYRRLHQASATCRALTFTISATAYIAALFSRENALLFPALLGLTVFTTSPQGSQRWRDAVLSALPYALLAVVFLVWRHTVLSVQDKLIISGYSPAGVDRMVSFFRAVATYAGLLVWPAHLQMERYTLTGGISARWLTMAGVGCVLAMVGFIAWARRQSSIAFFGAVWFVIALAPMVGLLNLNAPVAEHWLYVPAVGLYVAAAAILCRFRKHPAGLAFAIVCLVALTLRTALRNRDWSTPLALFTATERAAPYSAGVRSNLGQEYQARGDSQRALHELEVAEEVGASDLRTKSNLAAVYQASGNLSKARKKIAECLSIDPHNTVVLLRAAAIANESNNERRADQYFVAALGTTTDVRAWLQYGEFLLRHARYHEALSILDACQRLDPHCANVFNLRGAVQAELHSLPEADSSFQRARKLDRHSPDADINLGRLACLRKDWPAADLYFQRALEIRPGDPRAQYQLGRLAWQRGDHAMARQYLESALATAPRSQVIRDALDKLSRGEIPAPANNGNDSPL